MTFFFLFFGIGAIQPFVVPYLRQGMGMSALKGASVIGVLYLVFGIARFFTRYVIRLIEKRWTIILGACGYLCLPISLSLGGNYAVFMVGAVLMGTGAALVWTASSVQVLDTSENTRYGAASGVMYFFVQAGISLGTILAGAIAAWTGNYLRVFQTSSLIGGLAIASAFLVPEVRSKFVDDRWEVAFRFFRNPSNWVAPAALAISFSIYGIMLTMFNQFAATTFGPAWLAVFHTGYLVTGTLVTLAAGHLSDRIGRVSVIALSFAAGTVGLALFGLVSPAALGWTARPLFAVGAVLVGMTGAIATAVLAWVGDQSSEAERPTIHACVFAWRDFGFVGVTYLGVLLQVKDLPLQSCFLVFSGVFLAAAVVSGLLAKRERFEKEKGRT
jgi:MFS family permease